MPVSGETQPARGRAQKPACHVPQARASPGEGLDMPERQMCFVSGQLEGEFSFLSVVRPVSYWRHRSICQFQILTGCFCLLLLRGLNGMAEHGISIWLLFFALGHMEKGVFEKKSGSHRPTTLHPQTCLSSLGEEAM